MSRRGVEASYAALRHRSVAIPMYRNLWEYESSSRPTLTRRAFSRKKPLQIQTVMSPSHKILGE